MEQPTRDWLSPLGTHRRHIDVAPVVELVGDARIVALGEGAHNIEDFHQVRNDLLRALVTGLGFSAVVMESGFAEGLAVDAYVQGGDGTAETVARRGISYRFGECVPAMEQLTWLRAHNASVDETVHWYGMDLPGDSTSPEPALRACLSRIPTKPGDEDLLRLASLGRRARAAARWAAMSSADRDRLYGGIGDVVQRTLADGDAPARHCAAALVAFVAESRWSPERDEGSPYPRDAFMAETVRWVAHRHERVLVCAHNAHVQRSPIDGRPMLGAMLATVLGEDLRVIGQTYGAGPEVRITERSARPFDWDVELVDHEVPPGSLELLVEGALDAGDGPPAYLVRPDSVEGELAADVAGAFDVVVHHRRVRQVPGAFERLRQDLEDE